MSTGRTFETPVIYESVYNVLCSMPTQNQIQGLNHLPLACIILSCLFHLRHKFSCNMRYCYLLHYFNWACARENQQFGFRPGPKQTGLYSHRRWLEAGNFGFRKYRNQGADQLRSYCEADLHLCFRICRLLVFSCGGSIIITILLNIQKRNTVIPLLIFV